jgi:hypothetical protein
MHAIQKLSISIVLVFAASAAWMLSGLPGLSGWESRYDDVRLAQLSALGVVLLWCALSPGELWSGVKAVPRLARISVCLALLVGAISASRARFPDYAFIEWSLVVALLVAGLALHGVRQHAGPALSRAALLVAASGALILAIRLATDYVAAVSTNDPAGLQTSWISFVHPRYFAKAVTWALPLLWAAPFLVPRYRSFRIVCLTAAIIIWSHLIGSGSRGALGGMAASAAIAALFFGKGGKSYAAVQAASALLGGLIWACFVWKFGALAPTRIVHAGLSGREALIAAALSDIAAAPLLGIGPMHYATYTDGPSAPAAGAHDLPLQLAAEWGLPAAALLLAPALWGLFSYFLRIRRAASAGETGDDCMDIALFSGMTAALLHSLVANVLNDPISQTFAVLAAGLVFIQGPPAYGRVSPTIRTAAALVALTVTAGLCLAVAKGARCVGRPGEVEYSRGSYGEISPRFWTQGWIPLERTCREAGGKPDRHA